MVLFYTQELDLTVRDWVSLTVSLYRISICTQYAASETLPYFVTIKGRFGAAIKLLFMSLRRHCDDSDMPLQAESRNLQLCSYIRQVDAIDKAHSKATQRPKRTRACKTSRRRARSKGLDIHVDQLDCTPPVGAVVSHGFFRVRAFACEA